MSTIPLHVMSLTEYLITLTLNIQEFVRSLLNRDFVTNFGHLLLGGSSCLLVTFTQLGTAACFSFWQYIALVLVSVLYHHYSSAGACFPYTSPSLHTPAVQLLILDWTAESGCL